MSDKTIDSLLTRMKVDRAFRSRMLSAGKDGFAAALRQEGYGFTPAELKGRLPAVKTGLRVGTGCSGHCYCDCDGSEPAGGRRQR